LFKKYKTLEEAELAKYSLDGISWPSELLKNKIRVNYINESEVETAKQITIKIEEPIRHAKNQEPSKN
jgi:hypothetical protein